MGAYYNTSNGLFYHSLADRGPLDLWTSAYIRQGLCTANQVTGGAYRNQIRDSYYGFENYFKSTFTWTETIDGVQRTTTDPTWWGNGVSNANDDWLWNINAAICAYEATGDYHMLEEAERNARWLLETQIDSRAGFGANGMWRTWSQRDYKDISTGGQMPYIAIALSKYFPNRTIMNNASGISYTYRQYAQMTFDWIRLWIQPDGSILNGTNGSLTGYFDRNHYMMNVGLVADSAAAMYEATGDASYISDAVRIIDWGRNRFTLPYNGVQILWPQWLTPDLGVHYNQWVDADDQQNTVAKGIMSRGIINFMQATGQKQYMQWMEDDAQTAWNNRQLSTNRLYTNWQVPNTLPTTSLSSGNFTGVDIMYRVINAQTNPSVINPSFESNGVGTGAPIGWGTYNFGNSANDGATYTESKAAPNNARTGSYMLTQYKATPYQTYASQSVNVPNGTYTLTAWARSGGGQATSYLEVKDYGSTARTASLIGAAAGTWTQITIPNVQVTNRRAVIGVYTNSPGGKWINVDDIQLIPAAVSNPPYTARNFSFEDNNAATPTPNNWGKYNFGNAANDASSFVEYKGGLARSGNYILTHYKNAPYQIYTSQTVTGLTNGVYNLSAWVRSTGGQTASYMAIKDYGGGAELTADARQASNPWRLITINNVPVTNGQATIGFYSNAGANQWLNIDDVNLARH